jgi:hypothetical protein
MESRGILFEISPWGTGFIDELSTHRALGFHHSMLSNFGEPIGVNWPNVLEGRGVSFVETAGKVSAVRLVEKSARSAKLRTANT